MKYFTGITTIDELKKVYRKLCQLRYNELCKQYPQAEHVKNIDKARWEK